MIDRAGELLIILHVDFRKGYVIADIDLLVEPARFLCFHNDAIQDAAHLLASEPVSVQLRYLQTLTEIGVEKNTTVVFPVPVDFFAGLQKLLAKGESPAAK